MRDNIEAHILMLERVLAEYAELQVRGGVDIRMRPPIGRMRACRCAFPYPRPIGGLTLVRMRPQRKESRRALFQRGVKGVSLTSMLSRDMAARAPAGGGARRPQSPMVDDATALAASQRESDVRIADTHLLKGVGVRRAIRVGISASAFDACKPLCLTWLVCAGARRRRRARDGARGTVHVSRAARRPRRGGGGRGAGGPREGHRVAGRPRGGGPGVRCRPSAAAARRSGPGRRRGSRGYVARAGHPHACGAGCIEGESLFPPPPRPARPRGAFVVGLLVLKPCVRVVRPAGAWVRVRRGGQPYHGEHPG